MNRMGILTRRRARREAPRITRGYANPLDKIRVMRVEITTKSFILGSSLLSPFSRWVKISEKRSNMSFSANLFSFFVEKDPEIVSRHKSARHTGNKKDEEDEVALFLRDKRLLCNTARLCGKLFHDRLVNARPLALLSLGGDDRNGKHDQKNDEEDRKALSFCLLRALSHHQERDQVRPAAHYKSISPCGDNPLKDAEGYLGGHECQEEGNKHGAEGAGSMQGRCELKGCCRVGGPVGKETGREGCHENRDPESPGKAEYAPPYKGSGKAHGANIGPQGRQSSVGKKEGLKEKGYARDEDRNKRSHEDGCKPSTAGVAHDPAIGTGTGMQEMIKTAAPTSPIRGMAWREDSLNRLRSRRPRATKGRAMAIHRAAQPRGRIPSDICMAWTGETKTATTRIRAAEHTFFVLFFAILLPPLPGIFRRHAHELVLSRRDRILLFVRQRKVPDIAELRRLIILLYEIYEGLIEPQVLAEDEADVRDRKAYSCIILGISRRIWSPSCRNRELR